MTGVWQQNGCGLAAVSLSTFLGTVGLTWVGPAAESWCHGGRLPGGGVAGACFVAIHNTLGALLERRWALPKNGRRARHATEGVLR